MPSENKSATEKLKAESINFGRIGLRRIRKKPLLPEEDVQSAHVGISFSPKFIRRIDALASEKYGGRNRARSAFVKDMVVRGIEEEYGEDWERRADMLLLGSHPGR